VELEQFLHAFASRGFVSVSWAFLLPVKRPNQQWSNYEGARGGLAPLKDRETPSKHLV